MFFILILPIQVHAEGVGNSIADGITVAIKNYYGMTDTVTVQGLAGRDVVKVYSASNSTGRLLGSASVPVGKDSVVIYISQLGAKSGSVFLTVTSVGSAESARTEFIFDSESAGEALDAENITIVNKVGLADTIEVMEVAAGDIIKVYDAAGVRVLSTGTVATGKNNVTLSVAQLGQGAGAVKVTRTQRGYLESEKVTKEYEAEQKAPQVASDKITITNLVGVADTVQVTDLTPGDIIKVYDAAGVKVLSTGTVATGKNNVMLSIAQLGQGTGAVKVTRTQKGYLESEKVTKEYEAEQKAPVVDAEKITITNLVGVADTVQVTDLTPGDIIKVYDAAGVKVLSTGTVATGKYNVTLSIAQLGQGTGAVKVTRTQKGYLESEKVTKEYEAEQKAPVVDADKITITNLVGVADTVQVTDLIPGDIIKVYDATGVKVLSTGTVATGKNNVTLSVAQLGQGAGAVKVTRTQRGYLESEKVTKEYEAEQKAPQVASDKITITNLVGVADTVQVTDLTPGDIIKVYEATGVKVLSTGTVATGKNNVTLSVAQLGQGAGAVKVTRTQKGYLESEKVTKEYEAEQKAPVVDAEKISITNLVGVADTVQVTDLTPGDIIKVYDAAGVKVLATGTVATGKNNVMLSVAQLGQVAGSVKVTRTQRGYLESEKVTKEYEAEQKATVVATDKISITNLVGVADSVQVTDLTPGDIIKVYDAAGVKVLSTGTVATGKNNVMLSVAQLGQVAGSVKVTRTQRGYLESEKVTKEYEAEQKAPVVDAEKISITNLVGVADTVQVTDLTPGDIIKVYDAAGVKVLATGTVTTGKYNVMLSIAQLGQGAGSVKVTRTQRGYLESEKVTKEYDEEQKAQSPEVDKITVINNVALPDTIEVQGIQPSDVVKVYNAEGTKLLGSATVASGKTSAIVSVAQLGQSSGIVHVTLTRKGYLESVRVEKEYGAEAQTDPLSGDQITITNKKGQPDVIEVKELKTGDIVKVYNSPDAAAKLIGSATVPSGKTSVSITIAQLGQGAGNAYLSRTEKGKVESERVSKGFYSEGQLIEAIGKVNAAIIYEGQPFKDYDAAFLAMEKALENPVLALDFGQLYSGFSDGHKDSVFERMGMKAYAKPFQTRDEIQLALTQIIQNVYDRLPAYQEGQKYVRSVTIASDVEVGTILNDRLIKLLDGKESNPKIQMLVSVEGGETSNPKPAQYLSIDAKGTIKLKQKNKTTQAVVERVLIKFVNLTGSYGLYVNVRLLPIEQNEMVQAIEKVNEAIYSSNATYEERQAAFKRMLEALQSDVLDLDFGKEFDSMTNQEKDDVAYNLIYRITRVKPFVTKAEIQTELAISIREVLEGRMIYQEMSKYFDSVVVDRSALPNDEVPLLQTKNPNPTILVQMDHIADENYQEIKDSEYLSVYAGNRVLLKKKNTTDRAVVQMVVLRFTSDNIQTVFYKNIKVKILPVISSEEAEAIENINAVARRVITNPMEFTEAIRLMLEALESPTLALDFGQRYESFTDEQKEMLASEVMNLAESDPFSSKVEVQDSLSRWIQAIVDRQPIEDEIEKYKTSIVLNSEVLKETDVTDLIVQLNPGEVKNPDIYVKVDSVNGKNGEAAQYLKTSNGRILVAQQNNTTSSIFENAIVSLSTSGTNHTLFLTINVKILPVISAEEAEVIAKVNEIRYKPNGSANEYEAVINQMKQAISDPLIGVDVSNTGLTDEGLKSVIEQMIYLVSTNQPFNSVKEVQDCFIQKVKEQKEIQPIFDEMEKYYFDTALDFGVMPEADVTNQVLRMVAGAQRNPDVQVRIQRIFGGSRDIPTPSEYLKLKNGKIILMKQNTSTHVITEFVYVSFSNGADASFGDYITVRIAPNLISDEIEALNRINAIRVNDWNNADEVSAAREAMIEALMSPLLALHFGDVFDGFSDRAKEHVYWDIVSRVKFQAFMSIEELQAALDDAINKAANTELTFIESDKYVRTATISGTVQAGSDVTAEVVRLLDGEEANSAFKVWVNNTEGAGGNDQPSLYLELDEEGRVKLKNVNLTGTPIVEHVHLWFKNNSNNGSTITVGIRVDVTIEPSVGSNEISEEEAIAKINAVSISDSPTETERTDAVNAMKEALMLPVLGLRFGEIFEGLSNQSKERVYLFMISRVKNEPLRSKEEVQITLDEGILLAVNMDIVITESEKYARVATISGTIQTGADVTEEVVRLENGEEADPEVQVSVNSTEGTGGNNQPSVYLEVDEEGKLKLKKTNQTDAPIVEHVQLWFTKNYNGNSTTVGVRVDVTIDPSMEINRTSESREAEAVAKGNAVISENPSDAQQDVNESNDSTDDQFLTEREAEKYVMHASISNEVMAGDDITDQIIRLAGGSAANPEAQVTIEYVEGQGGDQEPSEYLSTDEHGRIFLKQMNSTEETVTEYVHLKFSLGRMAARVRVKVEIEPQPEVKSMEADEDGFVGTENQETTGEEAEKVEQM
ncbi:hypothetical protein EDM59_01400 [Brevibacillus nitrificans]|uniref:Uncharacterized protein n=2 Tax=Brevibacillus nitrificans TaxID=651560 RepID=A0A3M8DPZ4_9BACL|nr:hypothetical protein EDM59_01400 [Brevibacillus nitrificans]